MATKAMTKSQIIKALSEELDLPKKAIVTFIDALVDLAVKETKRTGVFTVPGFGKLRKAHRKARMGRNPQTGEEIKIPAKTVAKFRLSKTLKDAIVPPKK